MDLWGHNTDDNSRILALTDVTGKTTHRYNYQIQKKGAINLDGLEDVYKEQIPTITSIDKEGLLKDIRENYYPKFCAHLPK